ncbi:6-hydroxymethylpterin diphosphokinase MptE-like protein [Pseudooceanicola sp. C21-150M6]|uniref:6-hydroxymethylpterin diphosphokinase MptE-like protein n=1 Tax=Pseudooceanicola sp. C21-150M6 TaxID=3434355 RepID=UPI003D7FA5D7
MRLIRKTDTTPDVRDNLDADLADLVARLERAERRLDQVGALEEKIGALENSLRNRGFEINKLKYQATLANRTMESAFRAIFGRSLNEFVDIHKGERCFVVGNGPSLNKIDMTRLKSEITLGSNRAFLGFPKWGFSYNYWMVQDRILADQNADEFAEKIPADTVKFIPYTILKYFNVSNLKNVVPVHLDYTKQCTFSNDPSGLHEGFTVTVGLLQIAAIMGCRQIILVGADHNYPIPESNVNSDRKWSGEGLQTHFSEDYTNHQNGQVWEMPDVVKMTKAYDAAAKWAEENGIEILNASPGSKLNSFPKVSYDSLF